MTDEEKYIIEKNFEGRIAKVTRKADGLVVPLDAESSEYIEFIEWAKERENLGTSYERLDRSCQHFNQEANVIDYCKRTGTMLFVRPLPGQNRELHFARGFELLHAEEAPIKFLRLQGTATAAPDDALDEVAGIQPRRLPIFVTRALSERLNSQLTDEDSDIRKLSSWPVNKTFVYVDVSGFSRDHKVGQQALIINSLVALTNDFRWWPEVGGAFEAWKDREASLCIGDGYVYVFRKPHLAVFFAAYLASLIDNLIAKKKLLEFHFRMSVHTGPVYRFWDVSGKDTQPRWNYIGKGITDAERVLTAIGNDRDDVVFISAETRQAILAKIPDWSVYNAIRWLQNRGRQADKHNEFRRLYEVNHSAWIQQGEAYLHLSKWFNKTNTEATPEVKFDATPWARDEGL